MGPDKIFIGSSTEAEPLARSVGALIEAHAGKAALLWSDVFPAGEILLERIERLPDEVVGAVLVATPDLECRRNGSSFAAPAPNVVFEYAYLSARLGRRRVAILRIDDAGLPSDLQGVKLIADNQQRYNRGAAFPLLPDSIERLGQWLAGLPRLAPKLAAMHQVHGYSGTWDVRNQFTRWREADVHRDQGESVYFSGKTFVVFNGNGKRGSGVQIGKLHVSIRGYSVVREVVNEILDAEVNESGAVGMRLKVVRSRIVPGTERGARNADPRFREDLGSIVFPVSLTPHDAETATLRGPHEFERGADAKAQLAEEKFVHVGLFVAPGLEN